MRVVNVLVFVGLSLTAFCQTPEKELDKMMQYAGTNGYFNGSIAVLEKGHVVYENSFGYANFNTREKNTNHSVYELASVTKQFTAMCIMMLHEQGKLNYDDSLKNYFPELPYRGITIRHLLHHTSGLPDYIREIGFLHWDESKIYSNQDALKEVVSYSLPRHFAPGERYEYCNTGYMLLALIVEKTSGNTFGQFLSKNIFQPLNMTDSRIFPRYDTEEGSRGGISYGFMYDVGENKFEMPENIPELRALRAFGGLYGDGLIGSSVHDQVLWQQALFTEKLVKKESMQEAITSGKLNDGKPCGYGFGWFIQQDSTDGRIIQHTGGWSGVRNAVVRWLDKDRVLIVLRNDEIDFRGIQDAVKNILNGKPWKMPKVSMAQSLAFVSASNQPQDIRKKYNELKETQPIVNEGEIDRLGYILLNSNKLACAVEVLKINTELFPASETARENYKSALEQKK